MSKSLVTRCYSSATPNHYFQEPCNPLAIRKATQQARRLYKQGEVARQTGES